MDSQTIEIEKAEQQLIGFIHAHSGFGVISLISEMGLKQEEWQKINAGGMYIPKIIKEEIDEYFTK